MFMNPTTMDETARKYWELTRGEILEASLRNVGGGRGGGGACHWLARSTTYTCYVCGDFRWNIVFDDVFCVNFACFNLKNAMMKFYVMTVMLCMF